MRKKTIVSVLSLTLILSSIVPINGSQVKAADSNWTLLEESSDEFNENQLDNSKWKVGLWYDVTSALAFKDSNVSVRDGNLILTAKQENYNGKSYTCGAIESKFELPGTDCYVEVRAKALDKDANVLSAIWLQSSPLSPLMNPNPEIDIMETVNYSQLSSTLHTWEQTPQGEVHYQRGTNNYNTGYNDISDDFHTYGLERNNGKLKFYFDGKLAWEKAAPDNSFTELARHMVLSLEGHLGAPNPNKLPSEFLVDYVRTYYRENLLQGPANGKTYQIVNKNSGLVLSVPSSESSGNPQLVQNNDSTSGLSHWITIKNSDHTYLIKNKNTGKAVDLYADPRNAILSSNSLSITQYDVHDEENQRWYIVPVDNDSFKIISMISGKALVVKDASLNSGAPIIQWTYEGSDTNDEWYFREVVN